MLRLTTLLGVILALLILASAASARVTPNPIREYGKSQHIKMNPIREYGPTAFRVI